VAVQFYTGDGKGKTTAAFGLALRAAGHGQRAFVAQFMKGRPYGEIRAVSALSEIEVAQFGWDACIRREEVGEFHIRRTREGLAACGRKAATGRYAILVLDEILVAQWFGLVGLEEVAEGVFDLPVRRGDPAGIGGLVDRVNTPDYAAGVGMILYGYNQWKNKGFTREKKRGFWAKMKDWLKEA